MLMIKETFLLLHQVLRQLMREKSAHFLRSQSLATSSTIARIFGLACPYVSKLSVYWKPLPMLVLETPALVASVLIMMLPDTTKKGLLQNTAQAIELNR
jgi:hypothetical protein